MKNHFTGPGRFERLLMMFVIYLACAAYSHAAEIQCTKTVSGESGSGQKFSFEDRLTAVFDPDGSARLDYYSDFEGQSQHQDDARIVDRGQKLSTHPDYTVYEGADRILAGSVAFAVPKDILNSPSGTYFTGYFQTRETDTGSKKPLKADLDMDCTFIGDTTSEQ